MAFWATLAEHQGRRCEFFGDSREAVVGLPDKEVGAGGGCVAEQPSFSTRPLVRRSRLPWVRYAGWVTLVIEDGGPGIVNTATALRRGVLVVGGLPGLVWILLVMR